MEDMYYTLYSTSYGTVKSKFKEKMEYEKAEALGIDYCKKNGHRYYGTFNELDIDVAHDKLIKHLNKDKS